MSNQSKLKTSCSCFLLFSFLRCRFVPVLTPVPDEVRDCLTKEVWHAAFKASIVGFWENEGKRFKWFCDKHSEFIEYYESGKRYNDSVYFLRENDIAKDFVSTSLHDMDKAFTTSHERLLRSYLANKKYWEYCRERRVSLVGSQEQQKNG